MSGGCDGDNNDQRDYPQFEMSHRLRQALLQYQEAARKVKMAEARLVEAQGVKSEALSVLAKVSEEERL